MSLEERLSSLSALRFLDMVATRSAEFAGEAGVGGVETAGHLISYLADHPEDIEPWIVGGFFELPANWIEHGRLTFHARNGKVTRPQQARFSRIVKCLEKGK